MNKQQLIQLVLDSFRAEQEGNTKKGLNLISPNYQVIEMYLDKNDQPFPTISGKAVEENIKKVYQIKGREYQFKNILADEEKGIVIVEWVESYIDELTGQKFRTPIVGVFEIKNDKIQRARHYTDPRLSWKYLSQEVIDKAFE
ncbi:nuclear transport factor 2 family protein [Candidatus Daviesbacteria bacterium]|nr:nuclear transport factor 2 family protein [Candidatus Daviesbacteria bacterium]